MPQVCTMCTHPEYQNIVRDLNANHRAAAVSRKYSTPEHPLSQLAIRRCYVESLHHFRSRELTAASVDYYDVERAYARELAKAQNADKEELQRLRKHKQALRAEILKMKETLQARVSTGGPRLVEGELVGINVRDPESWPDWLPVFTLRFMDALVEDHDRLKLEQAVRDMQAMQTGRAHLPTRRVRQQEVSQSDVSQKQQEEFAH